MGLFTGRIVVNNELNINDLELFNSIFINHNISDATFDIIEPRKCTGTYFETGDNSGNGKDRPPPGTPCKGGCIEESGRWGENFCDTIDGNWGAQCMECKGKNLYFLL